MRMCNMEEPLGKVPCQVCIMVIVLDTVISEVMKLVHLASGEGTKEKVGLCDRG